MPTVLIIDDNPAIAAALDVLFALDDGIRTVSAASAQAGLQRLAQGDIDLVIQDMNFERDTTSGEEGAELFARIHAQWPDTPVILLTAWTQLERAVELVKAGAADYIGKPWDDRKLLTCVRNLLELSQARRELADAARVTRERRQRLAREHDLRGVIYADPASERVLALACQVARSPLPVLITGPNGSGKEKIAEILHANSRRRGAFVAVNCGALPAELIEAELFGAEAGAYTGANRPREGKFEAADGGTLFLDEIGTLPAAGQARLLRVLESGRFTRLGSNRECVVDVRVLSATNADLPAMIGSGSFREDLYYRLNAVELRLPPLRERPEDILPLARHFLGDEKTFSRQAERALRQHAWPGNVRELRNAVQRARLLEPGAVVDANAFGFAAAVTPSMTAQPGAAEIHRALAAHQGVIAQAAAALGLTRQSLYRRMQRLGIDRS